MLSTKKFNFMKFIMILQKKCNEYYSLLCGIHDKISPIFVKSERSASKKESST